MSSTREGIPLSPGETQAVPPAWRPLVFASAAAALAVPVIAFFFLFPLTSAMPTWDQWSLVPLWKAHYEGRPVLALLFEPYNGHLNWVPRFLFYGLGVLSRWNLKLEVITSYLVASTTLFLLCQMLLRHGRLALTLALPVAAQVFSFLQFECFLSGYSLGQNLEQMFATLCLFLLTRRDAGWRIVVASILAAAASTFSWGAGLAAFFAGGIALAVRSDRSRTRIAVWVATLVPIAVAVKLAAAKGLPPPAWKGIVAFFLALLGKPWTPIAFPSPELAVSLGALALGTFATLMVVAWRTIGRASLQWIMLGLLTLASTGFIALGRSASTVRQALASHYVTATYPLVVVCTVLAFLTAIHVARRTRWRRLGWFAALLVVVFPTVQAVVVSRRALLTISTWEPTWNADARAIALGTATDDQIKRSHHPTPELVREGVELMRVHRLAWFRDGASLTTAARPAPLQRGPAVQQTSRPPNPAPPPPSSFYRVEWESLELPTNWVAGQTIDLAVSVRNVGSGTWPDPPAAEPSQRKGDWAVRLSYRWLTVDRQPVTDYFLRADLPAPVRPGDWVTIPIQVQAPPEPGNYQLQLDLVHEWVAWFEKRGATAMLVPVTVVPAGEAVKPAA